MPACAKSGAASTITTSRPACAATCAMPCPIWPAPTTPSFLTSISGPLDEQSDAFAAADTQRRAAGLDAGVGHRVQQRDENARARRADRVAERDRAAPDVHLLRVEADHLVVDDR